MPLDEQIRIVETIIFASENPISPNEIVSIIKTFNHWAELFSNENDLNTNIEVGKIFPELESFIISIIEKINHELSAANRPYSIIQIAGGYTFATKQRYGKVLSFLPAFKYKKRLTKPMLETLTIIAYHQPITKSEIEKIRGVNSGEIINTLLEKELIQIVGRKETLGKPLLYGTTTEFLKLLGINSIDDLPKLSEISTMLENRKQTQSVEFRINFDGNNSE